MSKVIISLVSEQRMQNIIPVFQKGMDVGKVWLVRSTDADEPNSRFARALQNTKDALSKKVAVYVENLSVGAYGIAETKQVVETLIQMEPRDSIVVNFTGGTKCMSIGAYLAARDAQVAALYVDTANEKLVWFYPDGQVREEGFDLAGRLTVDVYLSANGQQEDKERTQKNALPQSAYDVARQLLSHWPSCRGTLEAFGSAISRRTGYVDGKVVNAQVVDILDRHKFVQRTQGGWQDTQLGRSFLNGKWLEAMVHVLLEGSGLFDDVRSNLYLQGVENELDVLATRRGQLAIIECKSGDLGGQKTLNRLLAIRTRCGTFARAFFVTSRDKQQVDDKFRNRAREYGVREIITAESLLEIHKIVSEMMRGVP